MQSALGRAMHSILATGLVSLGKEFIGRACEAFRAQGPQENFKNKLAPQAPGQDRAALEVHKCSLERQILQHPAFKSLGLDATSLDPFCLTPSPDGTYTLTQGQTTLRLDAKSPPLGPLVHNYYKTREALEASNKTAHQLALGPQTFSFHLRSFS